jgi:hypothetical protein
MKFHEISFKEEQILRDKESTSFLEKRSKKLLLFYAARYFRGSSKLEQFFGFFRGIFF